MVINTRRALYKKFRLEGMSGVSAAIKAGYSLSTAKCGKLHKAVGLDLAKTLELRGLSNFRIADRIIEGVDEEDGYLAHKYLETVLKIRGDISNNNGSTQIDKMQVNVYLPQVSPPKLP